jgi:hypothetical protein
VFWSRTGGAFGDKKWVFPGVLGKGPFAKKGRGRSIVYVKEGYNAKIPTQLGFNVKGWGKYHPSFCCRGESALADKGWREEKKKRREPERGSKHYCVPSWARSFALPEDLYCHSRCKCTFKQRLKVNFSFMCTELRPGDQRCSQLSEIQHAGCGLCGGIG